MQAAGTNCVRLCHYPHDESTLELCDELGLTVFAEIPVFRWIDAADDVMCLNHFPSWGQAFGHRKATNDPEYATMDWRQKLEALAAAVPDKPILITEFPVWEYPWACVGRGAPR